MLVLLAVVTLVGGVVGAVVLLSDDDPGPTPVASGPPSGVRSSAAPESSASPGATSATIPPRIGGWQGVASRKHGLAYDVPPNWDIKSAGTIVGFEDDKGNPLVGMSGAAGIERGDCTVVRTGVSGGTAPNISRSAKLSDLPGTAQYAARRWANAGYTPKSGRAPTVRLSSPIGVSLGGIKGYQVTAGLTVNGTRGSCDPPQAVVYAVAFPSTQGDPVVFIAFADRGVPGAVSDQDLRKVISSIRPLR
jgi:hypothetical protein